MTSTISVKWWGKEIVRANCELFFKTNFNKELLLPLLVERTRTS